MGKNKVNSPTSNSAEQLDDDGGGVVDMEEVLKIQSFLREAETTRKRNDEASADDNPKDSSEKDLREEIDEVLGLLGVVPVAHSDDDDDDDAAADDDDDRLPMRPFDFDLFRMHLQPPLTTLAYDEESKTHKDVFLNEIFGCSGDLANRPLSGNLSEKLSEYTRGAVGRRMPFRAGGLDDVEENDDTSSPDLTPLQTADGIRRIMNQGHDGGLRAWLTNEPDLLKAPVSISTEVGITPELVYDKSYIDSVREQFHLNEESDKKDESDKIDNDFPDVSDYKSDEERPVVIPSAGLWADNFYDDDSIFGPSSEEASSSESENDSDDGVSVSSGQINDGPDPSVTTEEIEVEANNEIAALGSEDESDDISNEVDLVLNALSKKSDVESYSHSRDALKNLFASDPQEVSSRKSWAGTESLDVSDFFSLVPNPAITYPFELDDFQKQAVARLERAECIFVAAHTSAGKTVCAEYAIALARKHCTRAIYTSPIKALSNQKYRDFKKKFEDVGLITGDIQIAPDSSCLIMTTEILRSMLYRGADIVRDIEWVIFDEVHYINDSERGVVWEEVIIMLPPYVNLIFLSATTPNTIEFSDWIGRTKKRIVHVIRTNYRPVPLSHNLFAGLKLHQVREGRSGFLMKGHLSAKKALTSSASKEKTSKAKSLPSRQTGSKNATWQQMGNKQNWTSLVKFLEREDLMPTVAFSFSKKKCEEIAYMLRTLDLNTAAEKSAAHAFAVQAMSRLSPNDATLPQVQTVCEMVKRGIGVHHGGLLPILKEMVEMLFSRNLIKVLFATETFAMGVNMPARSVVFNSIRKHDGVQFRELQPGEYTQMAGRAGRRGIDKVGTVIICCFGEKPPPQVILEKMLTGTSTKLQSQFRLTYNMILNLLRVEDMSVEDMIKRSFSEFATQRALTANNFPKLLAKGSKTLLKLDNQFAENLSSGGLPEDIEDYFLTSTAILSLSRGLHYHILSCGGGSGGGGLGTGRIVLVTNAKTYGYVKAPAMILRPPLLKPNSSDAHPAVCFVLLPKLFIPRQIEDVSDKPSTLKYIGTSHNRYYAIHEIKLEEILYCTDLKRKIDASVLFKDAKVIPGGNEQKSIARGLLGKVETKRVVDDPFAGFSQIKKKDSALTFDNQSNSHYPQSVDQAMQALLDAEDSELNFSLPALDLKICTSGVRQGDNIDFRKSCDEMDELLRKLRSYVSHVHPQLETHYKAVERKEVLRARVGHLRHALSNEGLELFPDFLQRKALLHSLNYVDSQDVVCLKGRVACEVNTCESLIITELLFSGALNELEPAEIVAALSALVFQEKKEDEFDSELPESLVMCCIKMKEIATSIGALQLENGLKIDPKDFCDATLKFGLVHPVYDWAQGIPFRNICDLTLVQEGSIVRCITRLDELCREVRNCARVVGNPSLYRKMEAASVAIKRDIVFASSLYVS